MKSRLFKKISSLAVTVCICFSAGAQQSVQFSAPANQTHSLLQGQIDWPSGKLENWEGPVVLFISSGIPNDRDGWLVRAMETVWAKRTPLKELSAALVKQGIAVIRFDNPGVLSQTKRCRETIFKRGLSEQILWQNCLDLEIVSRFTPDRYVDHIEQVVFHVQDLMPAAHTRLVMFGFSEGLVHAAALADRGRVKLGGFISIGSPAEEFYSLSRWQGTDRVMETLDAFDANSDGIISNEEITRGYREGVNRFMSLSGWLSEDGYWDSKNRHLLADSVASSYDQILKDFSEVSGAGRLDWKVQANGVRVPDMTEALWRLHFYGQTSPAKVMHRLRMPGLFLWGGKDLQVGLARQIALIDQVKGQGADIIYKRYAGRHHLLSQREDLDWLEKSFMPVVAKDVVEFLDGRLEPKTARARPRQQPR